MIGTLSQGLLWLVSGVPGSGKSSVADALARKYPRGVHIPIDDVREFVKSGIASPLDWSSETSRQFEVARRNAARLAADHIANGFTVVIDDVVKEADMTQYLAHLGGIAPRKVLLSPSIFVVHRRNAQRTNKSFDTKILGPVATRMHGELLAGCPPAAGWVVLDTSTHSISDTVDTILGKFERIPV